MRTEAYNFDVYVPAVLVFFPVPPIHCRYMRKQVTFYISVPAYKFKIIAVDFKELLVWFWPAVLCFI